MGNFLGSKTLETVNNLEDILNEIWFRKSCLNAHIYLVSLMYVIFWRSLSIFPKQDVLFQPLLWFARFPFSYSFITDLKNLGEEERYKPLRISIEAARE